MDDFDIGIVTQEMGHQFDAKHTYIHTNEYKGEISNVQPDSGSTIIECAGDTYWDVQLNNDPFFHTISTQEMTHIIKSKDCSVNTDTGNSIPTVNPGLDCTIPKETPFVLTGTREDADMDSLIYIRE